MKSRKTLLGLVCGLALTACVSLLWRFAQPSPPSGNQPIHNSSSVRARVDTPPAVIAGPTPSVSDRTWRPFAHDAFRNYRRSGYAWILRQFGASEKTLDRLAAGDFEGAVNDLTHEAKAGDQAAIKTLGWLSWLCRVQRSEEQLAGWQALQEQAVRSLPPQDAAWFSTLLQEDIAGERRRNERCGDLDRDQIAAQLTALADRDDGASAFILALDSGNMTDLNRLQRQAAMQGFPEGEYEYALALFGHRDPPPNQPGDPGAMEWLARAAAQLPLARAALASCEYQGCDSTAPDIPAALKDARAAAEQGYPDTLIDMGKHLPLSVLSADEAEAWKLFQVALQERGCRIDHLDVGWMKSMAATLSSANATSQAQQLADRYWQQYGASALTQLGC